MNTVFLVARVIHVLMAALWLGSVVLIAFYLMPVIENMGPDGGKVMAGLDRKGLVKFMASISGFTLLTGLYLYWHLTEGFDPARSGMLDATVFGAGGVLGMAAGVIGGAVVGRASKQASALAAKIPTMPEKDRGAAVAQLQALKHKLSSFGRIVVVLLVITITLMAIGHYV